MSGTQRLSDHHDRVGKVAEVLDEIRRKAHELGSEDVADRLLLEADRLRERKFRLVVIGEFSRGKSTLINALLGELLLPAKLRPTTTTIIEISHGADVAVQVHEHDGSRRSISPGEIRDAVAVGGEGSERSRLVTIQHPSRLLANGLVVVDTPGVNDLASLRQDITLGHLPAADAVMFVLDAKACFTESERLFLARDVLRSSVKRVMFVLNKADQLEPPYDPVQIETLIARVREFAGPFTDVTRVLPVAARAGLRAKLNGDFAELERSGLLDLEARLSRFLVQETGALVIGRALRQGLNALGVLSDGIAIRRSLLCDEHEMAAVRVLELRQRALVSGEQLRAQRQAWDAHCDEAVARVRSQAQAELQRVQEQVARVQLGNETAQAIDLQQKLGSAAATIAARARESADLEIGRLAQELHGTVIALSIPVSRFAQGSYTLERVEPVEDFVTPSSALAAAGAMGLAALLTSLVPGGILFVGAAAFLVARTAEAGANASGRASKQQALSDLADASGRLDKALAQYGREASRAAWNDVAGPTVEHLSSSQVALAQAERDLDGKSGVRGECMDNLAKLAQQFVELRGSLLAAGASAESNGARV
jgi:GTPase SAR1 family protein